jgi:hypothetical protein
MKYRPGPKAIPVPVETLCVECGRKSTLIEPLFTGVHCPWCKGEIAPAKHPSGPSGPDDLVWWSKYWIQGGVP